MLLITHSLLNSWLYALRDNPYGDDEDPMEDFMRVLRRESSEPTEAMQKGIDFENLVTAIATGGDFDEEHPWYKAASKVADMVRGGLFQYKATKRMTINGLEFLLYGRLDVLRAGEVEDIKFSGSYSRGKFVDYTQHPMYLELIPEAEVFRYIISNGTEVWTEEYRRDETSPIEDVISDFADWLLVMGLMDTYKEFWTAREN